MTVNATPQKRPWRTPELRDLGSVADLTQAGGAAPSTADSASYGT